MTSFVLMRLGESFGALTREIEWEGTADDWGDMSFSDKNTMCNGFDVSPEDFEWYQRTSSPRGWNLIPLNGTPRFVKNHMERYHRMCAIVQEQNLSEEALFDD